MEELAFEVGMEAVGMEDVGMVRMEVALLFVGSWKRTWTWKAMAQVTVDVAGVAVGARETGRARWIVGGSIARRWFGSVPRVRVC